MHFAPFHAGPRRYDTLAPAIRPPRSISLVASCSTRVHGYPASVLGHAALGFALYGFALIGFVLIAPAATSTAGEPAGNDRQAGDSNESSIVADANVDESQVVDFNRDVQPLLARRCLSCHGPDVAESGFALHSRDAALAETYSGLVAIVPGDAEASELIARVTGDDEYSRMPPEGEPLKPAEVQTLRQWIDQGAAFPEHWAFEPIGEVAPPVITTQDGESVHPVDAFLLERLRKKGLTMNPPADRRTLIRRATFDLTGLPPTEEEIEAFVNDSSADAYERLIDSLLASPHYGERWGRHWLDLVRYAETNSFERDAPKPNAWKYRDYVIRSFNEDKPYDQFVREQLAGDQLPEVTEETLTATGYYRLGIWDDEPADPLQARYDELDDLITVTGQTFLGLTINCARCHDHKIDPIPQADYYRLLSFFADVTRFGKRGDKVSQNQVDVTPPKVRKAYESCDRRAAVVKKKLRELEQAAIAKMSAPDQRATEGKAKERQRVLDEHLNDHLTSEQQEQYAAWTEQLHQIEKERRQLPPRRQVLGLGKLRPIEPTHVLLRGNPQSEGVAVEPKFPELFESNSPNLQDEAHRRRALADWIVDPQNRLTSRVLANRLWQHHFGRGIVRSPNNFGKLGVPPTHPKLLDYLAMQLTEGGWRLKAMHRLIMTSDAYRMSSAIEAEAMAVDPDNDLFWRFDPRRLSAEEVRDAILAVNGTLNTTPYGPSFYPELSAEVLAGQSRPGEGWGDSSAKQRDRRSVYIHVKRSLLTPLLSAFDFPEPDTTCEARFATLQPSQAMALLNSDFIHEEAAVLADAVSADIGAAEEVGAADKANPESTESGVDERWMQALIRRVFGRRANEKEIREGITLYQDLVDQYGVDPLRAKTLVALGVLNWNEFVYLF